MRFPLYSSRMKKTTEMPKHIAITMGGHRLWASKNKVDYEDVYRMIFDKINDIIQMQVELNVPLITIYALTAKIKEFMYFSTTMDSLAHFFNELKGSEIISKNKIKISVLGKWYDLPGRVVDAIKEVIDETKDYDCFFLNLCINYDGQEEIVDACKLIARKIKAGRLDPEAITKDSIKENIYSSYFLPVDLIIKTGKEKALNGFLLWDSTNSKIFFSNRLWMDLNKDGILKAIEYWKKN